MNDQAISADPTDPVSVLQEAVVAALQPLRLVDDTSGSAENVKPVLSTFARSVSPVLDQLAAMATADPGGPVDAALKQLRRAFNDRGTGTISPTCRWQLERAHIALARHSRR